uniref:Phorbol-ester/DAG-type domain-containing protein n=1 Tax=Timema bartmani TaxID=61472 RepID=A0A7R9HZZ5_9NEOP|nr:unnamed protein product [Timema bartmani]
MLVASLSISRRSGPPSLPIMVMCMIGRYLDTSGSSILCYVCHDTKIPDLNSWGHHSALGVAQERNIPSPLLLFKERENCAGRRARRVCFIGETSSNTRGPSNEREREGEQKKVFPHIHTHRHIPDSLGNSELRHHRHGRLRRHRQTLRRELCALGLKLTVTEPAYGTAMIVYGSEITVSKRVPGECVRVHYACVPCVSKVRVWRERCRGRLPIMAADQPAIHGHSFAKKTFHKPTYCHHCSDMLWGLIQQGYICEVPLHENDGALSSLN